MTAKKTAPTAPKALPKALPKAAATKKLAAKAAAKPKAKPKAPAKKRPVKSGPSTRNPAKSATKSYVEKVFTWFNPSADKARTIAERFVIDRNPVEALRAGGYADTSINSHGHVIMRHPRIVAEVEKLQIEIRKHVLIDESYVLASLHEVAEKCLGHVPIIKLDENGEAVFQLTFNPAGATKALENIGRHFGMFKDVLEISEGITMEQWVTQMEKAMEGRHGKAH